MHVVASLNDEMYQPLADITWTQNKIAYCQRHGYAACNKTTGFYGVPIGFEKILYLQALMENSEYEWIWWTGCDTLVTNFWIRIEEQIDNNFDLIIANDVNNFNSDSFLIKNSDWSKNYLQFIMDAMPQYKDYIWKEQGVMIDSKELFEDHIKVMPQKFMNSWPYYTKDKLGNLGQWSPGDWLIHFCGMTLDERLELASRYIKYVVG